MFSASETSPANGHALAELPPASRSRVTNGSALLPDTDGRSAWSRRLRDLITIHLSDLGGEDAVSEAMKAIVRRASVLTVTLERIESGWAKKADKDEEPSAAEIDLYQRASNSLRRLLESVGLERKAKDVTNLTMREKLLKASGKGLDAASARREAIDVEEVSGEASRRAAAAVTARQVAEDVPSGIGAPSAVSEAPGGPVDEAT